MAKLKVTEVGNSLGVILPKAVAARLKIVKGDALSYSETDAVIAFVSLAEGSISEVEMADGFARHSRRRK